MYTPRTSQSRRESYASRPPRPATNPHGWTNSRCSPKADFAPRKGTSYVVATGSVKANPTPENQPFGPSVRAGGASQSRLESYVGTTWQHLHYLAALDRLLYHSA